MKDISSAGKDFKNTSLVKINSTPIPSFIKILGHNLFTILVLLLNKSIKSWDFPFWRFSIFSLIGQNRKVFCKRVFQIVSLAVTDITCMTHMSHLYESSTWVITMDQHIDRVVIRQKAFFLTWTKEILLEILKIVLFVWHHFHWI